ncbi:hypothetical protein B9Z55_013159 [Caenorhabditis nigoni]|uniref:Uncharacterized protein n=1 Tax=Caenorhabditis nigoni TaxID=1611254 RepID=A0A2G5U0E9_9PELO|nr:hypothetical protein B9Z55_013159 [Caenorhabditis nigoni]
MAENKITMIDKWLRASDVEVPLKKASKEWKKESKEGRRRKEPSIRNRNCFEIHASEAGERRKVAALNNRNESNESRHDIRI